MDDYGRIVSVDDYTYGSELAADSVIGATLLYLNDVMDFEEPDADADEYLEIEAFTGAGGSSSEALYYSALDDDASTLTVFTRDDTTDPPTFIAGALEPHTAPARVEPRPRIRERRAWVVLDDSEEDSDPIITNIPHVLWDRIPAGAREDADPNFPNSEAVELADDGDEFTVVDVLGDEPETDGAYIKKRSALPGILDVDQLSAISADIGKVVAGLIEGVKYQTAAGADRIVILDDAASRDRIKFFDRQGNHRSSLEVGSLDGSGNPTGEDLIVSGGALAVRNALRLADSNLANQNPAVSQGTAEPIPHSVDLGEAADLSIKPGTWLKFVRNDGQTVWIPGFW